MTTMTLTDWKKTPMKYEGKVELDLVYGTGDDRTDIASHAYDVSPMLAYVYLYAMRSLLALDWDDNNFIPIAAFTVGQLLGANKKVIVFISRDGNEKYEVELSERLESIAANYKARVVRVK